MRKGLSILAALAILSLTGVAQSNVWVSAYYAGWEQLRLPPNEIDYNAFTHVIHFALYPTSGPNFSGVLNGMTPEHLLALTSAAHAAGKKAIISIGGWGADFSQQVNSTNRTAFINNLVQFMQTYGYDGLDLDWEPVSSPANWKLFIPQLRAAMAAANPNWILTVAAFSYDQAVVDTWQYFDQINLMTYDMSGPWPGWVTWHNSPVYDGGFRFPSSGGLIPSADGSINGYIAAGVPKEKLGIGMDFNGYVWSGGAGTPTGGVTAPRQSWTSYPNVRGNVRYFELMDTYSASPVLWDDQAKAAYISIDQPGSANDKFISLDNEQTSMAKAEYIRQKGIGGIILWELGSGYRTNMPPGQKDFLLQSVKFAFFGGSPPVQDTIPPTVAITSPTNGATINGTIQIAANASDNAAVFGVQFKIDGINIGSEKATAPYTASLNTWSQPNGSHTISAVARDASGNTASHSVSVTINNIGPPPIVSNKMVYDDALKPPFTPTLWGATADFNNTTNTKTGNRSVKVTYLDWGAFDLLSGTWNSEVPIDPADYDSLVADVYPTSGFEMEVAFYNSYTYRVTLTANKWNRVSVPLAFSESFTRFYFRRNYSGTTVVYFDNIEFVGSGNVSTRADGDDSQPAEFALDQNYPNPFNPSTTISYTLPRSSNVELAVYNVVGQHVATLVQGYQEAGKHTVEFAPEMLAGGIYFYKLKANGLSLVRKMILLK